MTIREQNEQALVAADELLQAREQDIKGPGDYGEMTFKLRGGRLFRYANQYTTVPTDEIDVWKTHVDWQTGSYGVDERYPYGVDERYPDSWHKGHGPSPVAALRDLGDVIARVLHYRSPENGGGLSGLGAPTSAEPLIIHSLRDLAKAAVKIERRIASLYGRVLRPDWRPIRCPEIVVSLVTHPVAHGRNLLRVDRGEEWILESSSYYQEDRGLVVEIVLSIEMRAHRPDPRNASHYPIGIMAVTEPVLDQIEALRNSGVRWPDSMASLILRGDPLINEILRRENLGTYEGVDG